MCNSGDFSLKQLNENTGVRLARSTLSSLSLMNSNVHVLRLTSVNQSRNYTCQAQNSFGLVVFNLTLLIKGF